MLKKIKNYTIINKERMRMANILEIKERRYVYIVYIKRKYENIR